MFQKLLEKLKGLQKQDPAKSLPYLLYKLKKSNDFVSYKNQFQKQSFIISYYQTLIDQDILHEKILPFLKEIDQSLEGIKQQILVHDAHISNDYEDIANKLLKGYVAIQFNETDKRCLLVSAPKEIGRDVSVPEIEFSVIGPQEAFNESITMNISLIRKRLPVPQLTIREFEVGTLSKTKVAIIYIDGVANQDNIDTVIQRVTEIEFDQILDSTFISQMLEDNTKSLFPQLINTERPERVCSVLGEGKIAVLSDGSPNAITGPTTLVEFFSSPEDYYLPWHIGSLVRLLRFFAVAFSVLATPIYVAVMTFHYELIPKDLLTTLIASRSNIPFPPIVEALFLEFTIELLREAGARLPTKVGQTIGIVGGIVIGQASVEAGLTSNILLIIVALSALASFTTPVYQMNNTIRILRFPLLLFAAFLGGIGIVCFVLFLLVHLLRLTSYGRPYLAPIYPPRFADWKDAFIRMPFAYLGKRPVQTRPKKKFRFMFQQAKQKKDIDE